MDKRGVRCDAGRRQVLPLRPSRNGGSTRLGPSGQRGVVYTRKRQAVLPVLQHDEAGHRVRDLCRHVLRSREEGGSVEWRVLLFCSVLKGATARGLNRGRRRCELERDWAFSFSKEREEEAVREGWFWFWLSCGKRTWACVTRKKCAQPLCV